MDANMNLKESNDRGRLWPLLFTILGAVNVFDFFYKSAHQTSDLLQGIGFLLVVPLAYFSPNSLSFGTLTEKPRASVWLSSWPCSLWLKRVLRPSGSRTWVRRPSGS